MGNKEEKKTLHGLVIEEHFILCYMCLKTLCYINYEIALSQSVLMFLLLAQCSFFPMQVNIIVAMMTLFVTFVCVCRLYCLPVI